MRPKKTKSPNFLQFFFWNLLIIELLLFFFLKLANLNEGKEEIVARAAITEWNVFLPCLVDKQMHRVLQHTVFITCLQRKFADNACNFIRAFSVALFATIKLFFPKAWTQCDSLTAVILQQKALVRVLKEKSSDF